MDGEVVEEFDRKLCVCAANAALEYGGGIGDGILGGVVGDCGWRDGVETSLETCLVLS